MSQQRSFQAKVFSNDGVSLRRVLTTDKPSDSTLMHLKDLITFKSTTTGGQGECVLDLKTPFDSFDEGVTVKFMNIVRIYAIVVDDSTGTKVQTTTLIYSGFISRYEPYIEQSGAEGVRVTCLGLISLLSASYYKSGSSFTVTHTSVDPIVIMKAIVDHFNTIYSGNLITYDSSSIPASVGTNVSYTFTDQKWIDALKTVGDLAGTGWWWTIAADGKLYFQAKPSSATHKFTVKKDIAQLSALKDSESVVNDIEVRYVSSGVYDTSDGTSQVTYGTGSPATGKRTSIINDTSIADATTATQRAAKALGDTKDANVTSPFSVNTKYNLETILVGNTCKIQNFASANTFYSTNMLIVSVQYNGDTVDVEVEKQNSNLGKTLTTIIENTAGTSSGSSGGGGGGGSPVFVENETPSGAINGINTTFTLAGTPTTNSLKLYRNTGRQYVTTDYSLSGSTITLTSALLAAAEGQAAETLLADYRTSDGSTNFADNETPSGSVNGINTTFTLAHTPVTGSLKLFRNTGRQYQGTDYSLSGAIITVTAALLPAAEGQAAETLLADYRF